MARPSLLAFFLAASAAGVALIPVAEQAELMRQANPEAGLDKGSDKGEACGILTRCADIKCADPFVLKRQKGQCCPISELIFFPITHVRASGLFLVCCGNHFCWKG